MCIVKVFQQKGGETDALYIEMKNKDGLVEIYGQLVDLVGIENTEKIYYTLRGQQIVFPMRLYKRSLYLKKYEGDITVRILRNWQTNTDIQNGI